MKLSTSFFFMLAAAQGLLAQNSAVTIRITDLPQHYPMLYDTLYLAGELNDWNPWHPDYAFEENEDGSYEITVEGPSDGGFQYKITRGNGWATVEGDAAGQFIPNRSVPYDAGMEEIQIAGWEDLPAPHTGTGSLYIMHSAFEMPGLGRHRRIWIWLPPDYESSEESYPVVYLHDGQNLFSQGNSFVGEWEIDESMAELTADCGTAIVVGIDNGAEFRIAEYSAWENPQYGGGEGDAYANFLVDDLKPFVDEHFRTLPDKQHTAIIGSSLGALISLYIAKRNPGVFGKVGLLSPAFWFNPEITDFVEQQGVDVSQQFYLLAGSGESATMVPLMEAMGETLIQSGHPEENVIVVEHADGQHSEWFWAREYPAVYSAFFCADPLDVEEQGKKEMKLLTNPADSTLSVQFRHCPEKVQILDQAGRVVMVCEPGGQGKCRMEIVVSALPAGLYYLRALNSDGLVSVAKVIIQH